MSENEVPSTTPDDLRRCLETLEKIQSNRLLLAELTEEDRRALLMAAGRVSRPERLELMKVCKKHRRVKRHKEQALDRSARADTDIRANRRATTYVPPTQLSEEERRNLVQRVLQQPRHCYVCKVDFQTLHFFYDAMCERCGDFNYSKRFQTASLEGKIAVITGSRLKIGYQAALMMLRAGARVIATTRFPRDSAERYSSEKDFSQWKDRLSIYGLDLRHAPSVELFASHLEETLPHLDILINNAAQTVRRPTGFYAHLLEKEMAEFDRLSAGMSQVLKNHERFLNQLSSHKALPKPGTGNTSWIAEWHQNAQSAGMGLHSSAALSQVPWAHEDLTIGREYFPDGKRDIDLQQVDLRQKNSWRLPLADVPTPEMIEVQLVNSIAPFILCAKLKPLMLRRKSFDKHIVNVSAMEGKFSRHTKTDKHPHTNMAKAALNMMTLTSAPDYAKDGIFMNAVDTGWVTDEDPLHLSARKQAEHDFQPPLDIVDGAARVCDPFFSGLITGEHMSGKFLKDYLPTDW